MLRAQEVERREELIQGFSRARLARFQPAMAREVERGSFNGAVALIARNGQIIHHEAYGHRDNARRVPMTRESIFLLASMTKPLTSVAAMMLVEEGRMKIGDPITQWLPELRELKVMTAQGEVPLAWPITVQDLLRHSSGFVYGAAAPFPRIREMYEEHDIESRRARAPCGIRCGRAPGAPASPLTARKSWSASSWRRGRVHAPTRGWCSRAWSMGRWWRASGAEACARIVQGHL